MNKILQGTTPTFTTTIDRNSFLVSNLSSLELAFKCGNYTLTKTLNNVTRNTTNNTISYTFTQAETLAMPACKYLSWQLRAKTNNGVVFGTESSNCATVVASISGASI